MKEISVSVPKFLAFDGSQFDTPDECRSHEEKLASDIRSYFLSDAIIVAEDGPTRMVKRYYLYPRVVDIDKIKLYFKMKHANQLIDMRNNFANIVRDCWNVLEYDEEMNEYWWVGCMESTQLAIMSNLSQLNDLKKKIETSDPKVRGKWWYYVQSSKMEKVY